MVTLYSYSNALNKIIKLSFLTDMVLLPSCHLLEFCPKGRDIKQDIRFCVNWKGFVQCRDLLFLLAVLDSLLRSTKTVSNQASTFCFILI